MVTRTRFNFTLARTLPVFIVISKVVYGYNFLFHAKYICVWSRVCVCVWCASPAAVTICVQIMSG